MWSTASSSGRGLYGLLEAALEHNPGGIALIGDGTRLTYRELADRVERLAAGLAARGVEPGTGWRS